MRTRCLLGIVAVLGASVTLAEAISPTADELSESRKWVAGRFEEGKSDEPFFSFTCGATPSAELLKTWKLERSVRKLDDKRTERTLTYRDPKTGLVVRCVAIEYADFPVIEWTVYLKNAGDKDTPLLEGIQGLDVQFQRSGDGEFVLHGIKGDMCAADSFEPYDLTLGPKAVSKRSPPDNSGKSCDGPNGWPYYNVQMPGGGVIVAVGWPGQWASTFTRDETTGLRVTAGQQLTHLFLKPGEEIRTPLIAMLFWRGADVVRSQNLWRRWYIAHVIPHFDGKPQQPASQIQTGGTEADIAHADGFLKAGIKPDICWRDAGWYPTDDGPHKGGNSWLNTGTWNPDPKKLPKGFRPFSDWAHAHGMAFLLWFEPERVGDPNSWLAKNHPEWLLPEVPSTVGAILNEGHPEAWKWLVEHVDGMIKSQGIDWYREDMNGCGPLPAWRKNDAEDRQGITENLYIQGHLAFWDELKRRNPNLRIDSCASGGRRNDLETMRRAVPLLRSDFQFPNMKGVVEGNQGHTYGLSFWIPPQGTGVYLCDPYSFRSFLVPFFGSGMGTLTPENIEAQKQYYRECRQIAPSMLFGDYYPLLPYSRSTTHWMAWQFNRPEEGEGVIQAFRHPNSMYDSCHVRLKGLEPDAVYTLSNFDIDGSTEARGGALMQDGLSIPIKQQPGSAVIVYRKRP